MSLENTEYEEYFSKIREQLDKCWDLAERARKGSADPIEEIEILQTNDMAGRAEEFLGVDGLAERIRELQETDLERDDIIFELTDDFLNGNLGDFDNPADKVEYSIRTALAISTEAVVAAPIEGLQWVRTEDNTDGSTYFRIRYGGPIRSAGGTAQVLSVIIADYCRQHLDLAKYKPSDEVVERYVEEMELYDRCVGLQYKPSDDEVRTIIRNTPVMLDAESVTEEEVSGYRDIDGIDTNAARGGMCLVAGEGIAQKVPKLQSYTDELGLDGWDWLTELPNASKVDDQETEEEDENEKEQDPLEDKEKVRKIKGKDKYVRDITAGRPIFSHPSNEGGFRLRYGRPRNTGLAAVGIHPATMGIVEDFIAPGSQLKTERPGKAAGAAPCESIEGPTVKLQSGEVRQINTYEEAEEIRNGIDKIIDIGEIAIPYGEFLENNSQLLPASYTIEWWEQEAEEAGLPVKNLSADKLNARQAYNMAEKHDIPLHPKYTYLWHDLSFEQYNKLATAISDPIEKKNETVRIDPSVGELLEILLLEHKQTEEYIEIDEEHWYILDKCTQEIDSSEYSYVIEAVNDVADVEIRRRAPVRIGARLGRPEKAERRTFNRDLNVHFLYPVGRDVNRLVSNAIKNDQNESFDADEERQVGTVTVDLAERMCPECATETWKTICPECSVRTIGTKECHECSTLVKFDSEHMGERDCPECETTVTANKKKDLNVKENISNALEKLDIDTLPDDTRGVEGLVSQSKIPEAPEKGILRAKHDIGVYEDGTSRYDATDLPLTSFKPKEVGASVERLRELGYETDIHGNKLTADDQLVELKMQDVVLPEEGGEYMLRVANFIDDLLEDYYEVETYYDAETKEDLIGELIIGLAPHTSAGALGRIIGYTDSLAQYAHPIYHASKRRNTDGDEDAFMLLLDGLLNYSEQYLNHHKMGWTMDEPIVLNVTIDPTEIDDEAHNVDIQKQYDLDFYEKTLYGVGPKEVDVKIIEDVLDNPVDCHSTLPTESIDSGPYMSAYKEIPSMDEKIDAQLRISSRLRATDETDLVTKLIDSHFLADLKGNLRTFSRQTFRCSNCNHIHRRPPLDGKCKRCHSESMLLTVYEGSVTKYLDQMFDLINTYEVPTYIEQIVENYEKTTTNLLQDDTSKQTGLQDYM